MTNEAIERVIEAIETRERVSSDDLATIIDAPDEELGGLVEVVREDSPSGMKFTLYFQKGYEISYIP